MISWIKSLFGKSDEDQAMLLPKSEKVTFKLKVDDFTIGILKCQDGLWRFKYTEEYKKMPGEYNRIIGFPDLSKEYTSDTLWPFFRTRIPGLKQPAVQEIIMKEHLDIENEAVLLKRFGERTISNPYILSPSA